MTNDPSQSFLLSPLNGCSMYCAVLKNESVASAGIILLIFLTSKSDNHELHSSLRIFIKSLQWVFCGDKKLLRLLETHTASVYYFFFYKGLVLISLHKNFHGDFQKFDSTKLFKIDSSFYIWREWSWKMLPIADLLKEYSMQERQNKG